jgi:DMSO/TMAO reductase YedYZ molybdopterin-dependent catalytic subunit
MKHFVTLLLLGAVCLPSARAQTAPVTLQVSGAVARPLNWSVAEVARQPHVTVTAKDKQGQPHQYRGVPLSAILEAAGAVPGGKLHGREFMKALKVTAADNYQVFFALAELDPAFATGTVILADQCDGKPLPAETGPWQVIVPGEKKPGRWVRQVRSLQVVLVP